MFTISDLCYRKAVRKTKPLKEMDRFNVTEFGFKKYDQNQLRDEWRKYRRNFEYIATAYEIVDQEKLKNIFLAKVGPDVQEIVCSIPGCDGSYQTLMSRLDEYFSPKQHEAFERHQFWQLKLEPGETLGKFMMRAQEQANRCNFGKNPQDSRNISVIDKIVLLAPQELREQLLGKKSLTIEIVNKTVNAYQAIKQQATQMVTSQESPQMSETVNRVLSKSNSSFPNVCRRCGYSDHTTNDTSCPANGKMCRGCGKMNHFDKMCRNRQLKPTWKRKNEDYEYRNKRPDYKYANTPAPQHKERLNFINDIDDNNAVMAIKIGGIRTSILIDSGTKRNIMDEDTYQQLCMQGLNMRSDNRMSQYEFKGYPTDSSPLKIIKVFDACVSIADEEEGPEVVAKFFVVEKGSQPLLGRDTAMEMGLLRIGLQNTINNVEIKKGRQFPKIKGVKLKIPIDHSVTPQQQHARRPPLALLKTIENKLEALQDMDIIEKVRD